LLVGRGLAFRLDGAFRRHATTAVRIARRRAGILVAAFIGGRRLTAGFVGLALGPLFGIRRIRAFPLVRWIARLVRLRVLVAFVAGPGLTRLGRIIFRRRFAAVFGRCFLVPRVFCRVGAGAGLRSARLRLLALAALAAGGACAVGGFAFGSIAALVACLTFARGVCATAALVGFSILSGRASALAIGWLTAAFSTAASLIARLTAPAVGLPLAGAGRLGLVLGVGFARARGRLLLVARRVVALRRRRTLFIAAGFARAGLTLVVGIGVAAFLFFRLRSVAPRLLFFGRLWVARFAAIAGLGRVVLVGGARGGVIAVRGFGGFRFFPGRLLASCFLARGVFARLVIGPLGSIFVPLLATRARCGLFISVGLFAGLITLGFGAVLPLVSRRVAAGRIVAGLDDAG
jgi:hypothetical protein